MPMVAPAQFAMHVQGVRGKPFHLNKLDLPDMQDTENKLSVINAPNLEALFIKWPHRQFLRRVAGFYAEPMTAPPEDGQHGISWIELCILFKIGTKTFVPNDLGTVTVEETPLDKQPPFKTIIRNFPVASGRVVDDTTLGPQTKAMWTARAVTGARLKCMGSLSSAATVGFTAGITENEYDKIHEAILSLHDIRTGLAVGKIKASNRWSTRRHINPRQIRPYKKPDPIPRSNDGENTQILCAIPIADQTADQPGRQPSKIMQAAQRRREAEAKPTDREAKAAKHGFTRHSESNLGPTVSDAQKDVGKYSGETPNTFPRKTPCTPNNP